MIAYVKILQMAKESTLPSFIDNTTSVDMICFKELYNKGYISAIDASGDKGDGYLQPSITADGRAYLDALLETKKPWWKFFDRRVAILSVVVGLIGIGISLIPLL